eukprot:NODE_44_length_28780_cov_0.148496.p5 type:complete len:421 gc:universal NODE_44_length_28780_cov_0.148496:23850-25112(+)
MSYNDVEMQNVEDAAEFTLPKEFENVNKRFNPSENLIKPEYEEQYPAKVEKTKKITLTELKKLSKKPENVDWVDCDARDPLFLVELKSALNTVPVPAHWSSKRKYLQSKRGIEKLPYELPSYIKETNISELRQAGKDKEDQQKLKQKVRARLHGKIHKLEMDYQLLHDAFFKKQEKPQMTKYGECFYEGKEFELKIKAQRAGGELSDELKRALGMGPKDPPPFLYNMQRYGPPPSYTLLKIPGVNSPIPKNASWGFHVGGYGKPPVDLHGRALYGDVFGLDEHKKSKSKDWIKPELGWGEMIDDTRNDDMVIDSKPMDKEVDIMESQSGRDIKISQISQEQAEKPKRKRRVAQSPKTQKPLYTVIEEEKRSIGDDIIGTDKGFKFEKDAKDEEKQNIKQTGFSKKRQNDNNKQSSKKFKY